MALGADGVGVGTGWMLATGCTFAQQCYTKECPAGITGSPEKLKVPVAEEMLVNYAIATRRELQNLAGSVGRRSLRELSRNDLVVTLPREDLKPEDKLTSTEMLVGMSTGLPFENGKTHREVLRENLEMLLFERR
jgi:hypothetical protein